VSHLFPSDSWVAAYRDALNASEEYRDAASTWTHGAIAFAVKPAPELGLSRGYCVWLDVECGRCDAARPVTLEEAANAPFCITATYERWRDVLSHRLDPIAGMLTRRLELRGNLITMMRYVRSSKAMVRCAVQVPSRFLTPDTLAVSGGIA
jgi:putative sterol carrier protein